MTQINLSDYKNIYSQTAKEYLNNLFSSYSKLIANSQDKEAINTVHISSHSLRSQSQVMGFVSIAEICANIEKISSDVLNGIRRIDDKFMVLLKDSIDELNLKLAQIEKTP